ncbi:unnamed protein product [Didymodactylos carnosus]|uniref:Uncharacterized protein n=1 Tax=Didymodactylos carnosus TaxID=1234261 RepID=A0A815GA40_9BILA|nr:unnamed protein product [Didymodactylos carnosus]CAF1336577.1 unnamed protein product [Didymodactylos carnosus]CAF3911099.1 unnamed protein product [Didymodactylos carnosus]CAF4194153.1 unnamed protein product [Didymodactylos carnosus]
MAKKFAACFGLGSDPPSTSPENQQHKIDFFEGENYELILRRLDEGRKMITDFIEQMRNDREIFESQDELNRRSAKHWKDKLDEASKIVSYGTNKTILYRLAESRESTVPVWKNVSNQAEEVITECEKRRDETYRAKRLGHGFEHRQTRRIRKLFENARKPVDNANTNLQKLHRQRIHANQSLADAQRKFEGIKANHFATEVEKQNATSHRVRKQSNVNALNQQINAAEEELIETKLRYREEAIQIFKECDQLETERLNFIQQTLLKFLDVIHPLRYFHQLSEISDQLRYDIQTKQNIEHDLRYWQRTYPGSADSSQPSDEISV